MEELDLRNLNRPCRKPFHTEKALQRFSKRMLTLSSFMAPLATSMRRKSDTLIEYEKYSTSSVWKEPVASFKNDSMSLPGNLDSRSDGGPCTESWKCHSNRLHSKWKNRDVKRQSSSSKLSEDKYDYLPEPESDNDEHSMHKRHAHCRRDSETDIDSWVRPTKKAHAAAKKDLSVIPHVIYRFWEMLDHRTYHHADKSSYYDEEISWSVSTWSKCIHVQMKSQEFRSFNKNPIFSFLSAIKLACEMRDVHDCATLWLLHFFMYSAAHTLNARIAFKSKSHGHQKKGTATS